MSRALVRGAWLVVGALVFSLFAFSASMSPWVGLGLEALVVAIVDLLALGAVARRTSRRTATRCGVVGLVALVVMAGGLYLSLMVVWVWLTFPGTGWLFWTLPAIAVLLSIGLLVRKGTRLVGSAVIVGSAEGFLALVSFFLAVVAACHCLD
jgi:hypothetical protein